MRDHVRPKYNLSQIVLLFRGSKTAFKNEKNSNNSNLFTVKKQKKATVSYYMSLKLMRFRIFTSLRYLKKNFG